MSSDNHTKEIDQQSGVETTGHEWDGIKELNNPAPRWWLWVFFLCFIWSVGYWIVYPAWPTLGGEKTRGATEGTFGWTQYSELKEQQSDILARRAIYQQRFNDSSFEAIMSDNELLAFSLAGGRTAFRDNCATCHGTGGSGGPGYPNLNDDDWLWGGTPDEIYTTIRYGIRASHDDTRISEMPAFGDILSKEEIEAIADYVYAISTKQSTDAAAQELYTDNCSSCHGEMGEGLRDFGAPALADSIWLYGGSDAEMIKAQITRPKHGLMPAWVDRLSDETIRQLTVYVHNLGGGE